MHTHPHCSLIRSICVTDVIGLTHNQLLCVGPFLVRFLYYFLPVSKHFQLFHSMQAYACWSALEQGINWHDRSLSLWYSDQSMTQLYNEGLITWYGNHWMCFSNPPCHPFKFGDEKLLFSFIQFNTLCVTVKYPSQNILAHCSYVGLTF